MDIKKIKPFGPWILVKVDPPPEKSEGGIYRPQGNAEDRTGQATGTVLRLGKGNLNQGKRAIKSGKYDPIDLKPGMRIAFRGYLQEANRPSGVIDKEHTLIHVDDIIGEVIGPGRVI